MQTRSVKHAWWVKGIDVASSWIFGMTYPVQLDLSPGKFRVRRVSGNWEVGSISYCESQDYNILWLVTLAISREWGLHKYLQLLFHASFVPSLNSQRHGLHCTFRYIDSMLSNNKHPEISKKPPPPLLFPLSAKKKGHSLLLDLRAM